MKTDPWLIVVGVIAIGVPNLKDPKVNPVQGTVVRIGANCEFAHMGIANTPRNPKNPGDYWWNIALHVVDTARGVVGRDHWLLDLPGVYLPAVLLAAALFRWRNELRRSPD